MKRLVFLVSPFAALAASTALTAVLAQPVTPATSSVPSTFGSVFNDAKAWAAQRNSATPGSTDPSGVTQVPGTNATVNSSSGQANVPHFATSGTQSQYFSAGQGQTNAPGQQRTVDCANMPSSVTGISRQECEAINFMQRAPTTRPQFSVNRNEALISNTRASVRNPPAALGASNGTLQGNYSQCVPTTVTSPITYRTEICTDNQSAVDSRCSVGQQIVVDAHHLYQCAEQLQNLTSSTCRVPDIVEVDRTMNFACTESLRQLGVQSCNQTLLVQVTSADNCTIGDKVGEVGGGWGYTTRNGPDLYTGGLIVRAYCNFLTQDLVDIKYFYGDINEGDYGSGASFSPPPDITLVPNSGSVVANLSEPVERLLQGGLTGYFRGRGIGLYASGQCQGDACDYTLVVRGMVQPNTGLSCYVGSTDTCTIRQSQRITFTKPKKVFVATDTWSNDCAALEARR
jgi:hypothetical protein